MAEVIDLEELRRIGFTLRRMQADMSPLYSRFDGVERRLAVLEERQAELEASTRLVGDAVAEVDRKLDAVAALVRDDVARLEARMEARFAEADARFGRIEARLDAMEARFDAMEARFDAMEARFVQVLAAIAGLKAS
ncbi:hypothetical protein [Falsiroseomonas selenitidurans]|uniref:Uncharacterized protein n=1 Tax=Falsiroseomonas selenitidurans TaxID=2716335 RepID=A0ABX1EC94_9PROT|nr:hypothetical protein [Falsiroseomonas selenitidurans]NKC34578.1 hypothetical protein [Falsiroseomonas selenitidurans]